MNIINKLLDIFTVKVVVEVEKPCTAPAPCPKCGMSVEVPLTRTPTQTICYSCKATTTTMAIGLCDVDEERLQYIYREVIMWVGMVGSEYKEKKSKLH